MISMIVISLLVISLIVNAVTSYLIVRASRRLLEFDELFELLADDIGTNLRYFEKLKTTPLISDTQEVQNAHKNMVVMGERLEEFVKRIEEQTGRSLLRKPPPRRENNRPVVV